MRHGSLFSGIGGFDLAARWLGWENIFSVEIDPFCRQVLKTHFPFATQYDNIKKFNGKRYDGTIDIISGGFPCQPFSIAGQRRGREDDRYLWPEMLRVIDEVRPAWVVGENVAGILSLVQPGVQLDMAMQTYFTEEDQEIITKHEFIVEIICKDIERIGYSVQPFLIPACGTGAPHRRNRVWFIAYANDTVQRQKSTSRTREDTHKDRTGFWTGSTTTGTNRIITNSYSEGLERPAGTILSPGRNGQSSRIDSVPAWKNWPTQSPVCGRDDGVSQSLVDISFSKWRKESIRSFGNAIVPQVAYQLFSAIELVHQQTHNYELIL